VSRVLLTCDGYAVIRVLAPEENASAACREAEEERDDGYACLVSQDGVLVADADGDWEEGSDDGRAYRDAIDRACGYLD